MIKLLSSVLLIVLVLSGCGWNGTPTRINDFTPLTSIEIVAVTSTIAAHTSTRLTAKGHFSGLFTRDVTDQVVWSSASPAVAAFITASGPNRVSALTPGTASLTATVGSISSALTLTVSSATVTTMTITPAAPTIPKGLNAQFAVRGTFSDLTTQDLTFDATWASSDTGIATVSDAESSKGLAHAIAVGTADITATFPFNGVSGTTLLTVTESVLQSVAVSPANPSILTLYPVIFKATGSYSDGTTADITSLATWSSSNAGIATIAASGAAKVLTQGTTTIRATLAGVSGTASLKATGGNLTGIALSPATPRLVKDTARRMIATGTFSNGASRDITGVVAWTVADDAIATVTAPGGNQAWLNALAVTPAIAVTATSGSLSATATLTVVAPALTSIAVSPTSLELTPGTSSRIILNATYSDGTIQDVTASAAWTSDGAAATVGNTDADPANKGRVSGVAAGAAAITAAYGGLTAPAAVTVNMRTLQSLAISTVSSVVPAGKQAAFTATASYSGGTTRNVTEDATWTIDKSDIAILVDSKIQPGQIVAVDSGSATLKAVFGGITQTTTVTVP